MVSLSEYKNWDSISDDDINPCIEYLKNTSKGKLLIVKDRSQNLWEIKLKDKEIFWVAELKNKSKEKEVIKFIWNLFYN